MVAFIDAHRAEYGVEPICAELPNAPSTYYLGAEAAALTHWQPDGYLPAGAMAVLARNAMRGWAWEISIAQILDLTRAWPCSAGTLAAMEAAAKEATDGVASQDRVRRLGEGWVGEEALSVGLYAVMVARSFAECIELAANHDGDSDSTASIAGQLWGARWGIEGIPRDVAERLDVIDALFAVHTQFMRSVVFGAVSPS